MFKFFDQKEEERFNPEEIILTDFILLAYGDTENKLKQDFIGTSKNKKTLKIGSYSFKKEEIKIKQYENNEEIIHVIPCNFTNTQYISYIIISKKDDKIYNISCKIINDNLQVEKDLFLGESDRIPFLFSHDNYQPSLILQLGEKSEIVFFDRSEFKRIQTNLPRLAENHTSGFIDVDGDLKAELVLVTEEADKKFICIMDKKNNDYSVIQKIEIPFKSGPLAFADFTASGCTDIAFVSEENDNFYLTVLFNLRESFKNKDKKEKHFLKHDNHTKNQPEIYNFVKEENYLKINLDMFQGLKPILKYDEKLNNLPGGIFIADVNLNSFPDIVLIMTDKNNKTHIKILMNNYHKDKHDHQFKELEPQIADTEGLLSVSFSDYQKNGYDGVILNKIKNADYVLTYVENNIGKDHYKFTAITTNPYLPKKSYGSYVPGVSYKYYIEEENVVRIGHQMPQSSFTHLQNPRVFFGLGSINFLVDKLYVGGPNSQAFNEIYHVKTKILPNSDLVLRPHQKGIGVELYLNFAKYVKNIIYVFCFVLFVNILIVVYNYNKERKREKKNKKRENFLYNFAAL
ncbi:hypothetical protein GVAV_000160 [Gurleya vavrai]